MTVRVQPATGAGTQLVLAPADVTAGDGLTYESGEAQGTLSVTDDVVRGNFDTDSSVIYYDHAAEQWTINFDLLGGGGGAGGGNLSGGNIAVGSITYDKLPAADPSAVLIANSDGTWVEGEVDSSLEVIQGATPQLRFNYTLRPDTAISDPPTIAQFQNKTFLFVYEP